MEPLRGHKFYDAANRRVVYVNKGRDASFWDEHWAEQSARVRYPDDAGQRSWVARETRKVLPAGARVLEGGCGLAENAWALLKAGYRVDAVDFAPTTVDFLHQKVPELPVTLGDVTALDFTDGSFDGYWSPGVIEHFVDGFDAVAREAARVIRPGGYFFLYFPAMSLLRRQLGGLGRWPAWTRRDDQAFYQFALRVDDTERVLERFGFHVEHRAWMLGLTGLEDTFPRAMPVVARLRHGSRPMRGIGGLLARLTAPFAGHMIFLRCRRRST